MSSRNRSQETTECTNANHQLTTFRERLNDAQKVTTESQDELLALRGQFKESEEARAIQQSKVERLQTELLEAKEAIYKVDIAVERRIFDLEAENTQLMGLRGLNEILEADITQLRGQKEALEAENTQLRGLNEILEADITQLRGQLHNSEELLYKAQEERNKLQETVRNGRMDEPVYITPPTTPETVRNGMMAEPVFITPPTTPEVPSTIPIAIPGQYPLDDNPQPEKLSVAEDSANLNVTNSSSTPGTRQTNFSWISILVI
ncbi:hypothetical protein CLAIMM_04155 [Cladophialophora immunda]|nr:hypothetical protein CLAIMM_04155 [Cladophialophora immunda]